MSDKKQTPEKKSGKGFFDKLKSMAFEDTQSDEKTEEKVDTTVLTESTNSKFVYSNVTQATNIPVGMPTVNGQFDDQFYKGFQKVLEDNNIAGVDYLEFSKAKKAMDNIPGLSEPVKYQSTFAQLQANSPDTKKEYLLKTADFYIEKLGEEEVDFDSEMQKEINAEVTARNQQVQEKSNSIKSKQEQIAALTAEINALNIEIGQAQSDAQMAQSKIEATAKNFKITLEVVKNQILLDKQNIQNFIQ